ncbi:Leucine rich repeat-containing protein, partial [Apibacter mensalis]
MKNYLLFLFYFLSIIYLHCQVKVIDVEDPGSLSKLLGNEINTITDLKIKGKINTSDLNTLNSMRKLSVLDLSHSSITDGILPYKAFINNTVLKNIILPSNLTNISKEAFEYAYNISVDASKCSQLKNIGEYAFNGVKGKVVLPDHLESLPYKSFANFNGTVSISKNLKTIGKEAFYNSSINTLDLAHCSQLKNIGEYAFNGVKGKVALPDHLESLPYKSFAYFNGTLVLPKNLKIIGQGAFYNSSINTLDLAHCSQLKNIEMYAFEGVKGKV